MGRCGSWRFVNVDGAADLYLPIGRSHVCWRPCRNRVPEGTARCSACEKALILCPIPAVRKALLSEENPSLIVLRSLVTDSVPGIAFIASQLLESYAEHDTAPSPTAGEPTSRSMWSHS